MNDSFRKESIALIVATILGTATVVHAQESISITGFNPIHNDWLEGKKEISSDATLNTDNQAMQNAIKRGTKESIETVKLESLEERMDDESKKILNAERINLGDKNHSTTIKDSIGGDTNLVILTYDTTSLQALNSAKEDNAKTYKPVTDEQYLDTRLADITGGNVSIELGRMDKKHSDYENQSTMAMKQSTLIEVSGDASVDWKGKNRFNFDATALSAEKASHNISNVALYSDVNIKGPNGEIFSFEVKNHEDFKALNETLIKDLTQYGNANTSREQYQKFYDDVMAQAIDYGTKPVWYEHGIPEKDELLYSNNERRVLHIKGKKANAKLSGVIEVTLGNTPTSNHRASILVDEGANFEITEDGMLSGHQTETLWVKGEGSSAINKGIVNGNFETEHDDKGDLKIKDRPTILTDGILVTDKGNFINEGIFNYNTMNKGGYSRDSVTGLVVEGEGTSATNTKNGIINIGVQKDNNDPNLEVKIAITGVGVSKGAQFINEGEIYVGREFQTKRENPDQLKDVSIRHGSLNVVAIKDFGEAINKGSITLGSEVENANAMFVNETDQAFTLSNQGVINLKSNQGEIPAETVGILAHNVGSGAGQKIENAGTINLTGGNNYGLKILADAGGKSAHAVTTDESKINVESDLKNGVRSYGVWVEGFEGGEATADLSGEVTVTGESAAGIHARNSAQVTLQEGLKLNLEGGSNQLGLYAYGAKAHIKADGALSNQKVSSESSTLMRIADGATLSELELQAEVSGKNSSGLIVTGAGSNAHLKNLELTVSGEGAKGVQLHAGSKGVIEGGTITLSKEDSVGILLDTEKTNLAGGKISSQDGSVTLTNSANISGEGIAILGSASNGKTLTLTNSGDLTSHSEGEIVNLRGDNTIYKNEGGTLKGIVRLTGDKSKIDVENTTLEGSLILAGDGANVTINQSNLAKSKKLLVEAGDNNYLTLINTDLTGATGATGEKGTDLGERWNTIELKEKSQFTLTGDLKFGGSELIINDGTALKPASGADPTIYGKVTNRGLIDFGDRNKKTFDTLTIKGDYVGGGRVNMVTQFNEGGALTNQKTDRLLIEGDVSGQTTLIVNSKNLDDTGVSTDSNRDGVVQNIEGISLVQVGGSSEKESFILEGGYVASGAFAYTLHAFGDGEAADSQRLVAGSGDFWDYRLANIDSTSVDPTPPGGGETPGGTAPPKPLNPRPVTAQVPAYITAPTGITLYHQLTIDDLHKRLGEVRYQSVNGVDNQGEVYARLIGARMKHKSGQDRFKYGTNFDLDLYAFQLGANLLRYDAEASIMNFGVAWTHGESTLKPKSRYGYSRIKSDHDTFGLYLTWQNEHRTYLDAVLAYGHGRGKVKTHRYDEVNRLKSDSWIFSLEGGHPFDLDNDWTLEPQVQLLFSNVKIKDSVDRDNARVQYDKYENLMLRLGLRAEKGWVGANGATNTFYGRINYYDNFGSNPKVRISNAAQNSAGALFEGSKMGRSLQFGVGASTRLENRWSIYGEVDYNKDLGSSGSKGWRGNIGVKWEF